ncbi:uncharacterized protein LOC108682615 [Hyalella azteca]|uniref:RBR-type E3 ubiquitin transferase n=1 Tax=Hyalella azteca TaxID=294128 RepID=A0A8B7PPD5_HYAAZ|nr:uncharacterized protein LOC108682615 [Hyalella azteca]XP_018027302.1 uncharacterized protein LOC108682615 [Hyalella azteca]
MAAVGPLISNRRDTGSSIQNPISVPSSSIAQYCFNGSQERVSSPPAGTSLESPNRSQKADKVASTSPSLHKLLVGSKSVPVDSKILNFREFAPPVPVHSGSPAKQTFPLPPVRTSPLTSPVTNSSPGQISSFNSNISNHRPLVKSLSPTYSSSPHNSLSPSVSPVSNSPYCSNPSFNQSFSPVKSAQFHKPLSGQRSSPSLHRHASRATFLRTPPKSPLLLTSSSRKLSCPKISRVSPTQFKFQQYHYSEVPKSDSAFSEDIYAYSPILRGYSPDSPVSPPKLKSSVTQDSGISYPYGLHKSESSYSEQIIPCRQTSVLPKSRSTIFRSDSAYSEIEYSYSTIPQSESFCLEEEYAYLSLPKSDSTYSENILYYQNQKQRDQIPRSLSSCSYQFANSCEADDLQFIDEEIGVSFCSSVIGGRFGRYRSLSQTSGPRRSKSQATVCPVSSVFVKPLCSSNPNNVTMPSLKSIFKTPPRQSVPGKASRYERTSKKSISKDVSAHSLRLLDTPAGPQNCIRKSHTVLALSSTSAASNCSASTKLFPGAEANQCKVHRCLSKNLLKSISQTLNSSIGQNLNKSDQLNPPRKRSRRRSQLSAFLPRSLSRASSIAPSLASAGASYLGSFIGSLGSGEDDTIYCRLCLMDVSVNLMCQLSFCQCRFCRFCMAEYVRVQILSGQHRIECPDGSCDARRDGVGELTSDEIEALVGNDLLAVRNKLKLDAEVTADPFRVFCPRPGCATVIRLKQPKFAIEAKHSIGPQPKSNFPSQKSSKSLSQSFVSSASQSIPPVLRPVPSAQPTIIPVNSFVPSVSQFIPPGQRQPIPSVQSTFTTDKETHVIPSSPVNKAEAATSRTRRIGTTVNLYLTSLPETSVLAQNSSDAFISSRKSLPETSRTGSSETSPSLKIQPKTSLPTEPSFSRKSLFNKKNSAELSLQTGAAQLIQTRPLIYESHRTSISAARVPFSAKRSSESVLPLSHETVEVTSENDLINNSNSCNTSIKNDASTVSLTKAPTSEIDEDFCRYAEIDEKSAMLPERRISLDEVNMIRDIKRPKILPLTSSPRPLRQAEYPADPDLSAALAGLQSPAEYRPFAALQMPLESSSDFRVLQGIPEQPDIEGVMSGHGVTCPTCQLSFCPSCGLEPHGDAACASSLRASSSKGIKRQYNKLMGVDSSDLPGVIKCCPNPKCRVPIERNEGCAQMQCRACKHTFCWYCLASLEEDFLLRHYDKGPCRNKLGHSRASVLCHRLQVIAIFVSVGLLVFAAAPLLVFVGPCVLCCRSKNKEAAPNSSEDC